MIYSAKHLPGHLPAGLITGIKKVSLRKTAALAALMLYSATVQAGEPAGDGSLKQVMQQLGTDYSALNHAILLEDFDGAAQAAHAIAEHDKPSMGQRLKIMASLGTDMTAFKQADGKVHDLAIEVEEAAKAGDMPLLMQRQSQLFGACMACHTTYRSKVIDRLK